MDKTEFNLPALLVALIQSQQWPTTKDEERRQELNPILGKDAADKVWPGERRIVLFAPPFARLSDEVEGNAQFWVDQLNLRNSIDYERSLIIGDFGLGSDSAIVLNFEQEGSPRVMFVKWLDRKPPLNEWVCSHETFEAFCSDIGLRCSDAIDPNGSYCTDRYASLKYVDDAKSRPTFKLAYRPWFSRRSVNAERIATLAQKAVKRGSHLAFYVRRLDDSRFSHRMIIWPSGNADIYDLEYQVSGDQCGSFWKSVYVHDLVFELNGVYRLDSAPTTFGYEYREI